jgi:hypothetical protein
MGIAAFVVFVFGVFLFFKRRTGEPLSDEDKALGGRIGRSVQGAVPIPGIAGQPGAHLMPARRPDEIGPEDEHIVVMKGPDDRPDAPEGGVSSEEVRARLDAIMAAPHPDRRRRSPRS